MLFQLVNSFLKKFGVVPVVMLIGLVGTLLAILVRYWDYLDVMILEYHFVNTIIPSVRKLLEQNQFCQVVVFSTISAYFLYLAGLIYRVMVLPLFAGISSSITIHNTDPNFNAVIDFVSDNMLIKVEGSQCSLQATTQEKKWSRKDWIREYLGADTGVENFEFRPDSDNTIHRLNYKGYTIMMSRTKSNAPLMGHDRPFTPESLTLWVWGPDNSILKDLLTTALEKLAMQRSENTLRIFTQSSSSWLVGWELAMTKATRARDSVILDLDDMDILLNDARNFLNNKKWYLDMGIPYRRGYLLYGPPGCGKTSFAQVLAGELRLDICMLNLTHDGMNDNTLAEYLRDAPFKSIIVLEDVDAIFVERGTTDEAKDRRKSGGVSFSGLLNAIDGVASQEGRIFFMTTNHIEKLDPALIRPGRCDVKVELKKASKVQMEMMFLRFYPEEAALAQQFASRLPSNELSMATLQGHFLKSGQTAQECISRIPDLLQSSRPKKVKSTSIYEHLNRVGLQAYAPVLESNGIETADDLTSSDLSVSNLVAMSLELKYDAPAMRMFEQILKACKSPHEGASLTFLSDVYALADISTLRESFLAAYPSLYETQHGEVAPFFRRLESHRQVDAAFALDELPPPPSLGSTRSLSTVFEVCDDESERRVDKLGREFCNILGANGKGLISMHNLRALLNMYPNRPEECVEGAKAFVQERSLDDELLRPITLYQFLKRAGVGNKIHEFTENNVTTVSDLLAVEGSDAPAKAKTLKKDYGLTSEEATDLAEILSETTSTRRALFNFGLHSRQRIIKTFLMFYHETQSSPSVKSDKVSRAISQNICEKSDNDSLSVETSSTWTYDSQALDDLAYAFGVKVTSLRGQSLVSLIEVLNHLKKYPRDPVKALNTVSEELLNPPYPEPPTPAPPAPKPTEWVYKWLKHGELMGPIDEDNEAPKVDGDGVPDEDGAKNEFEGEDLSEYAKSFIDAGLKTKSDLAAPPLLTDALLKDELGVSKLGHRRKIIRMQQKLHDDALLSTD